MSGQNFPGFQSRLASRSWLVAALGCLLVGYGYVDQSMSVSTLQWLLFVVGAALLPQGPPPTFNSAIIAASLSVVQASTYAALGFSRWQEAAEGVPSKACSADDPNVHFFRASLSFVWALGFLLLAAHSLRSRCEHFWTALRVMVGVCSGLRLATNVLMHHVLQAPPGCYLPGNLDLGTSLAFNAGCIALTALALSSSARHQLSEWSGGALVVFDLSEVSEMQEPKGGKAALEILDNDGGSHSTEDGPPADREVAQSSCDKRRTALRPASRATTRSVGSSAGLELGQLWTETPAAPNEERAGTAVFEDEGDEDFEVRSHSNVSAHSSRSPSPGSSPSMRAAAVFE